MQTGKNISKLAVISLAMAFVFSCSSDDGNVNGSTGISEPGYKAGYKACVLGYRNPDSSIMTCLLLNDGSDFPEEACEQPGDRLERSCRGGSNRTCDMGMIKILMYGEFGELEQWNCEWMVEFIGAKIPGIYWRIISSSSSTKLSSSSARSPSSSSVAPSSSSSVQSSSSVSSSSSSSSARSSSSSVAHSSSSVVPSSSSTSSSSTQTSACSGTFTDTRDSQSYRCVPIGNQVWMAENLNYDVSGSLCYDNNPANCTTYGRLYDWATAMSVCPSGWHLPSDDEWTTLIDYVESQGSCTDCAGTRLKATSGWNSGGNGTDNHSFSALPGGCGIGTSFSNVGYYDYWWSASEDYATNAYYRFMGYSYSYVDRNYDGKMNLFSVRCVQD
ncbi:MAG: fibrobacter succinogenes major paralogous domain-containing protein [Fibromonadales bacterium]|nr:fibrobacter succinogenes major paralogous domain-containing protein [Fibromonadales bacterium]